ncbi:RNA repair transcriptional activator RtcR [Achromobacter deleyi]|uniref:RNA repair transcriptional activator RtcR n=1 Tax=Achromobacter deleyi TaxID=1353891 RepID=UPI0014920C2D|nr:RNA repair transcriptional activator RtcR [Achromobacter deleyi]QVQ26507.1 RNA repair transcriptional activator RtcR [Achromobacter deleyi]UIP22079.1 RNA repair transcriptional activator RtcR [Achromobacter deleyi]
MKQVVVVGFIGTQLDAGNGAARWEKWRPTVALTQHEDRVVARMELLYTVRHRKLAEVIRADIAAVSPETVVNLVELDLADPWDFGEVYNCLHGWARAYPFDLDREQYWVHITTGTHVAQICQFLLVESRVLPGVLVQTAPPRREQAGMAGTLALIDLDLSRYDVIAQRFAAEQRDAVEFLKRGIATRNARFNALIAEVERVAVRSRAAILLAGPTGAGKSFLARRMFELKKARHHIVGPFVEVNCATLRGDTAAAALFGHRKGAYTGAVADRPGLLRTAHEGVLFLDEIGELGVDEQAMLLKAIEEKRFYPVGADREVESDFQLIAGTNRDLRREVATGAFREDLYARINMWTYDLPGLAQRSEDIEPNVDHLLALHASEHHQMVRFNVEARQAYLKFAQGADAPWRGNFRDLSSSILRMATLADGGRIGLELVQAEIERLRWLWRRDEPERGDAVGNPTLASLLGQARVDAMDLFDRLQLESVLRVCASSRSLSDAGRQLFQASRAGRSVVNDADRLRKYLAKHGLHWEQLRASAA